VTGAWRWSLVAVACAGFAVATLPLVLYWAQLPEPIAVHWSFDLRPDGAMAKRYALIVNAALIGGSLLLALIGATAASGRGRAMRLMIVTLISALAATTSAAIVARNLHKAAWTDAELTPRALLLMIGLPLATSVIAHLIGARLWRDARPPAVTNEPGLSLAAGTRVFWTGGASNHWLLVTGGVLLAQALALQMWMPRIRALPILLAVHVVVFAALEFFSVIRVTIDSRGLAVRYGHLGLWKRRVPLAHIAAAQALKLDALEHGGWGYRGGLRLFKKAAIVVRSGDAIRLELRGGRQLFVTVDDAGTAARLLNGLIEREPPTAGRLQQHQGAPSAGTHPAHEANPSG
jgi:hypothetical protein